MASAGTVVAEMNTCVESGGGSRPRSPMRGSKQQRWSLHDPLSSTCTCRPQLSAGSVTHRIGRRRSESLHRDPPLVEIYPDPLAGVVFVVAKEHSLQVVKKAHTQGRKRRVDAVPVLDSLRKGAEKEHVLRSDRASPCR